MAPFEVVIFHHLPGDHRAWCSAETAAELERTGIAKRPDDDRHPGQAMRQTKSAPKTRSHPGRGDDD
jgi:hypothetical protein